MITCEVINFNNCKDGQTDIGNSRIVVFKDGKFRAVLFNVGKNDVKSRIKQLKRDL